MVNRSSLVFSLVLLFVFVVAAAGLAAAPIPQDEVLRLQQADAELQGQIAELEGEMAPSASLERYEAEYRQVLKGRALRPADAAEVVARLAEAPYVLLSDEHTVAEAQARAVEVLRHMAAGRRPLTLVIEWIDREYQPQVDAYLAGDLSERALRAAVRYDELWGFPWKNYRPVLAAAKKAKVPVLLVDRLQEPHGLAERDAMITDAVRRHRAAHPGMRYLVVYGAFHLLGRGHLGDRLAAAGLSPQLVLVGEAEEIYWEALRAAGGPEEVGFVDLGKGLFYVRNGDPLTRHVAYRKYLMKLTGWTEDDFDVPLEEILGDLPAGRREKFSRLYGE